jgi:hypothetical protein
LYLNRSSKSDKIDSLTLAKASLSIRRSWGRYTFGPVKSTPFSVELLELAEHFSHSTDPADLAKAVKYGEMAAKRASSVYAYAEAAIFGEGTKT